MTMFFKKNVSERLDVAFRSTKGVLSRERKTTTLALIAGLQPRIDAHRAQPDVARRLPPLRCYNSVLKPQASSLHFYSFHASTSVLTRAKSAILSRCCKLESSPVEQVSNRFPTCSTSRAIALVPTRSGKASSYLRRSLSAINACSSARECTPSLRWIADTWLWIVSGDFSSASAIVFSECPCRSSRST